MGKLTHIAKKTFIGASILALVVGGVGAGGVYYTFHRAQPRYEGSEKLTGLSAPSEILRDKYGIPHIFAADMNDAARSLGYVHASERLFQMETQRRAGQGRLAELLGPDLVDIDKFTRTLGLYQLAQSSYAAMSPDAQAFFQSYADGVNAWLMANQNNLPPEFTLLGAKPESWQPADSLVWGKLMALQLSQNYHLEMLRAQLAGKIPQEQISWLFPMLPDGTPITTQPSAPEATDASGHLSKLIGLSHAASNEWVIGGARTETGKPILANDPHLDLGAPILWYLARIVTPQGSVKGATVPGLPIVLLGENDHVAWGFTTTGSDVQDLFVETVDPQNPQNYITPQGSQPFDTRAEVIHVKDAPDINLTVRATRHGPILSDIDETMAKLSGYGRVMALAFTGLGDKDLTSESLMNLNRAQNVQDLLHALELYQSPPQNIVYADDTGAFGFINPGLVPIRKKGDGLIPVDGSSGDYDWTDTIPFTRVPQISNPAAGYIFNANNAVIGPDTSDYFGQDWEEPYRARRLQQFFNTIDKFNVEKVAAMQGDHISLVARDFLPLLTKMTPNDERSLQALDLLRHWDGLMDKDKPEPAIFEAWLLKFHDHMMNDKVGIDLSAKGPFAAMTLADLIAHHAQDWCGDTDCHDLIEHSFEEGVALLTERQGPDVSKWRWGRENVAVLQHKFFSHIPLLNSISDLSVESSGDFYTVDRGGGFEHDANLPFARTHGGGFRGIYDLANPDASLFMIATGESGHIFSSHYGDLVSLWNNVQGVTLAGSKDELRAAGAQDLVLEP